MSRSFFKNILVLAVALLIAGILYYFHALKPHRVKSTAVSPCQSLNTGADQREMLLLPDGSIILAYPNTRVKISCSFGTTDRQVIFAGEAYFRIAPGPTLPFTVISKNLSVTIAAGSFHFLASPAEAGEQLELLRGSARAAKTYPSPDSLAETLHAGEMVMINRSIDLMEKENFDTAALSAEIKKVSPQ